MSTSTIAQTCDDLLAASALGETDPALVPCVACGCGRGMHEEDGPCWGNDDPEGIPCPCGAFVSPSGPRGAQRRFAALLVRAADIARQRAETRGGGATERCLACGASVEDVPSLAPCPQCGAEL